MIKEVKELRTIVIVKADCNDADYLHEITDKYGTKPEDIEKLKRIANIIKDSKKNKGYNVYNWHTSEYGSGPSPEKMYEGELTEEEIEWFQDYLPYGEYGIHTIEEIRILQIESEEVIKIPTL